LSIIDLAGGHQPMHSPDRRYVIVFNGEIYNYRELREGLVAAGERFETESDTEVLLRLYQRKGADALQDLNGMFAFAVWDRERKELFVARDRVGIKPLYYVDSGGMFLFASETKALLRHPGWSREINPHAVQDYLALRYVPGDVTLFRHVKRLPAAHFLRIRNGSIDIRRYWSAPVESRPLGRRRLADHIDEFEEKLDRSVQRRLVSDVPLGAYLSGGTDSSATVALMARMGSGPVKTFSAGFDYEHDELGEAADTARRLGCDHEEVECRAKDVMLLPEIVYHSDDPLGDAISIPMYQLARAAKRKVTVILTGEGGDEILGGYLFHKVLWAANLYRRWIPSPIRDGVLLPVAQHVPARLLNVAFRYPAYLGERGKQKALDYLQLIGSGSVEAGYRHLISLFDARDTAGLYSEEFSGALASTPRPWSPQAEGSGPAFNEMLGLQFDHWLPDNMLLRQDKMSMASGIEGRVPFLDHELIEHAFGLPRELRLRGLTGKYVLRRMLDRVLTPEHGRRRKMPFYVPIENFFEHPDFAELMEDTLGETSVRRRGLFNPEAVAALRKSIRRREFVLVKQVFSLMTLELWFRIFVDQDGRL
jgi:asparagine synthase (glutamine-hydrolysing)